MPFARPADRPAARMVARWAIGLVGLVLLAGTVTGCGDDDAGSAEKEKKTTTLTVFAAASLTETFTTLGKTFERANPGVEVRFNFGGSSTLAQQIVQGAPADVFASAGPGPMDTVTGAGLAADAPQIFVRNYLEIAVAPGNPHKISGLKDLEKPGIKVVVCAEQVPCGDAAKKALLAGGVSIDPVSLEKDVKSALNKVVLGEADAALVYRTDIKAAGGKVRGVDFPEKYDAINDYLITVLSKAPQRDLAWRFLQMVVSDQGWNVLLPAGFVKP
ncbi:MAG TPA: molybdate ABC transporter substrate-binding protein [Spirillospora sp.]